MKLFSSTKYPNRWFAFGPEIGWVMFPAEVGGWIKRQPARGVDPIYLREVPLRMGLNTGIAGAVVSGSGASDDLLTEGVVL
jgi:hypothetical protein